MNCAGRNCGSTRFILIRRFTFYGCLVMTLEARRWMLMLPACLNAAGLACLLLVTSAGDAIFISIFIATFIATRLFVSIP